MNDALRNLIGLEDDGLFARGFCSLGGGGTSSTNTIQNSAPWAAEQPYLGMIYNQAAVNAQGAQAGQNDQYYPGQTYQGLLPQQNQLINQAEAIGSAGGTSGLQASANQLSAMEDPSYLASTQGAFGQGQGVLSNELSPSYLNPMSNPGEQSVINTTLANVIPQATSSFTNGNRSDSGLATEAQTNAATSAVGNLLQGQYNTNTQVQNQAQQQAAANYNNQETNQVKGMLEAPSIDQAQMGDLSTGLNAATLSQQNEQQQINALMQQWNYNQMLPYTQLGQFEGAVSGTGANGGSTSTESPYFTNPTANILAGVGALGSAAAAGSALYSSGAGAALMGTIGSMFSDRELKKDIHKIGETDTGFPLYTFHYKGEHPGSAFHIGVMAQDVEKKMPDAVATHPSGFKMVDYDKALGGAFG